VLHRLIVEALPLDDRRRAGVIVVLAFTARAGVRPAWAEHVREGYDELYEAAVGFLRTAQQAGQDLDAGPLADIVLALSDGFSNRTLTDSAASGRLLTSLELSLRELLSPR
jgi:hypothetical protein